MPPKTWLKTHATKDMAWKPLPLEKIEFRLFPLLQWIAEYDLADFGLAGIHFGLD